MLSIFEDRILSYDIEPRKLITSDKKHLLVNNYALWKIEDPLEFVQSMGGLRSLAQTRIDNIVSEKNLLISTS